MDLLASACGRVLVGSRLVTLSRGMATLSLAEASKLFSNKRMWRCICEALSQALQDHLKKDGRLFSTEREEIELLRAAAKTRAKKRKLKFDSGTLSLQNAPPCVKAALEQPAMRNDARFHLGTICAELSQLSGADNAKLLVDALRDVIADKYGERRAKHFYYHANRTSTFNRKCITMASAPIPCTLGPELCIKRRKISNIRTEDLTPSIVWASRDSGSIL